MPSGDLEREREMLMTLTPSGVDEVPFKRFVDDEHAHTLNRFRNSFDVLGTVSRGSFRVPMFIYIMLIHAQMFR